MTFAIVMAEVFGMVTVPFLNPSGNPFIDYYDIVDITEYFNNFKLWWNPRRIFM